MNEGGAPTETGAPGPPCEACGRFCHYYAGSRELWCAVCQWWAAIAERGAEATNRLATALGAGRSARRQAGLT